MMPLVGALEAFADCGIDGQSPATAFFYAVFLSLNFLYRTRALHGYEVDVSFHFGCT